MKKVIIFITSILTLVILWSCKESFLELEPKTGVISDVQAFKTKAFFDGAMFGAYTEMQGANEGTGGLQWSILPGYISQDLIAQGAPKNLSTFLSNSNSEFLQYWSTLYRIIGRTNTILDRLSGAPSTIIDDDKKQIEGEAKFLRGFAYFMLARAYGDVPLITKPYDISQNSLSCTPEPQIWDQVISDLGTASKNLPNLAGWGPANAGRATKWAATAYLANAYMYKKDWAGADSASQSLVASGEFSLLPDVRQVFTEQTRNTAESIFEIQYRDVPDNNAIWSGAPNQGNEANEFTAPRNIGDKYAPNGGWGETVVNLKVASSYEPGDDRRKKLMLIVGEKYKGERMTDTVTIPNGPLYINRAFSTKYWLGPAIDNKTTYYNGQSIITMRYAEFLLNYSEVLFEEGKFSEAYTQLNMVRTRAKLLNKVVSSDRETFFTDLMNERRWELILEPNLWFHYTRTGRAAKFLNDNYGIAFQPQWAKFPIPLSERDRDPKICNNGY